MQERRLQLRLPPRFYLGIHCAVGAQLAVPVSIGARGVTTVTVAVRSDHGSLVQPAGPVTVNVEDETEIVVVLEARSASQGRDWVTIEARASGLIQQTGFFAEVAQPPE